MIRDCARYHNDVYNCIYDGIEKKCNSTAADFYGNVYSIAAKWQLAAINCTISNDWFTYWL